MSDSITFRFVKRDLEPGDEDEISPAVHVWYGGEEFLETVKGFIDWLHEEIERRKVGRIETPVDRLEPGAVVATFLLWLENVSSLQTDLFRGDPTLYSEVRDGHSWNGNWDFDLISGQRKKTFKGRKEMMEGD